MYAGDPKRTQTAAVTQPKWVVGVARVGGTLIEYKEDPDDKNTLTLKYCISEGYIQELRQVYIDGEEALVSGSRLSNTGSVSEARLDKYFAKLKISIRKIRSSSRFTIMELRFTQPDYCLLYTSPSPRDRQKSRMPSSA